MISSDSIEHKSLYTKLYNSEVDGFVNRNALVYAKLTGNAEVPSKDNKKNVAYDITLIDRTNQRVEDIHNDICSFTTGLTLNPPRGYYLEVLGTDIMLKAGYLFVSPQIIEPDTTGELIVSFLKFAEKQDVSLPIKGVRIVARQCEYLNIMTVAPVRKAKKQGLSLNTDNDDDDEKPLPRKKGKNNFY